MMSVLMCQIVQLLLTVTDNNPALGATIKSNAAALQLLLRTIEASIGRAASTDGKTPAVTPLVSAEVGVAAAGVLWNMDTVGVHEAMVDAIITSFVTHTAIDSVRYTIMIIISLSAHIMTITDDNAWQMMNSMIYCVPCRVNLWKSARS